MTKLKDRSGELFDRLTVVSYAGFRKSHHYWNFRCDCGVVIQRVYQHVKKQTHNACGTCKTASGSHAWHGVGEVPQDIWNVIRHGALDRDIVFSVTIQYISDLYDQQQHRCALTGWEIKMNPSFARKKERTASLDRIDPTVGYIPGNLQWLHRAVNYAKRDMTQEEFIKMCKDVSKVHHD